MSQMEAELKFPHVQNSQSRVVASLTHIANCPSNVRWRRLQTVARQVHDFRVSFVFDGPPVWPSSLQLFHYPPWRSTRRQKPGKARLPKIKSSEHPFPLPKTAAPPFVDAQIGTLSWNSFQDYQAMFAETNFTLSRLDFDIQEKHRAKLFWRFH